jgi:lysophospholipase L1-like esterase
VPSGIPDGGSHGEATPAIEVEPVDAQRDAQDHIPFRLTWTAWSACRSIGADPKTGLRILMIRLRVPEHEDYTYCNGGFFEHSDKFDLHHGFDYFIGGLGAGIDLVSNIDSTVDRWNDMATLKTTGISNGSVIAAIQVLTTKPCLVGMNVGDSHHSGAGSTSAFSNYLLQQVFYCKAGLNTRTPLGIINTALGGLNSAQFLSRFLKHLPSFHVDYVVLPGWSFNDHDVRRGRPEQDNEKFFGRLMFAANEVTLAGAIPIFLTPFPRDPARMTGDLYKAWADLRARILDLRRHGCIVIDCGILLGRMVDGTLTGTYKDRLSDDDVHPNDAGHRLIADKLEYVLSSLFEKDCNGELIRYTNNVDEAEYDLS